MANKVDVTVSDGFFKGTNFLIEFQLFNTDGVSAENIVGYTLRYALYKRLESAPLLTKTIANGGIVITDAPTGRGRVIFLPADTQALTAGTYLHSLVRTDAGFATVYIPGRGHPGASLNLLKAQ